MYVYYCCVYARCEGFTGFRRQLVMMFNVFVFLIGGEVQHQSRGTTINQE